MNNVFVHDTHNKRRTRRKILLLLTRIIIINNINKEEAKIKRIENKMIGKVVPNTSTEDNVN